MSVAVCATLFWSQARLLLPRNRFHDLAPAMRALAAGFEVAEQLSGSEQGRGIEDALTLHHRLGRVGITAPPIADRDTWLKSLPVLAAWAETKNLRAAKEWGRAQETQRKAEVR